MREEFDPNEVAARLDGEEREQLLEAAQALTLMHGRTDTARALAFGLLLLDNEVLELRARVAELEQQIASQNLELLAAKEATRGV